MSSNEIDEVILVGGSTRIPKIQEKLKKSLERSQTKVLILMR